MKERRSPRLAGFDYSQPGEYFVTVCVAGRACVLGRIIDGRIALSAVGEIVDACWRRIPLHFANVRASVYQVMPNHVHGIIEMTHVGAQHAAPLHVPFYRPQPGSLGVIVRSFKSASSKAARDRGILPGPRLWQRSYYDHIIRDERERFFTEQYITLNPLLWHLDRINPEVHHVTVEQIRHELCENRGLDGYTAEWILEQHSW